MDPLLTLAMLLAAAAAFAWTMSRRVAPLLALRREVRTDRVRERLALLLRFGLGQRRLVDPGERRPGLLHVALFAAFLVVAVRTVTLFGQGFVRGFHLPLLAPEAPLGRGYGLVKDVFVLLALAAVAGFLWRRLVTRPDRVTRSAEGLAILLLIAALMVTDMLFDGAGLRARGETGSWLAPAGSLGAAFLRPMPQAVILAVGLGAFWTHLALILVFGNLLPYGKHFHIITALPNVFLARLPPASAARAAAQGISCADELVADPAVSQPALAALEPAARRLLGAKGVLADDRSWLYDALSAALAQRDAGAARRLAHRWLAFLEGEAARARTPAERAAFDGQRVAAAGRAGEEARVLPALLRSERELPPGFVTPSLLGVVYLKLGKPREALAAAERALARAEGPRRIRVLVLAAEARLALQDRAGAKATLERAVSEAAALPEATRPRGYAKRAQDMLAGLGDGGSGGGRARRPRRLNAAAGAPRRR